MFQVYMPHQNLRCFGVRIGRFYCDVTPYDSGIQVYCNPWVRPHPRGGYRKWFHLRWLAWLSWMLT